MDFEIIGQIRRIEIIAKGHGIQVRKYFLKTYGRGQWRKLKGLATVRLLNGAIRKVELHWYESHAIGRRELKIKYYVDGV